MPKRPRRKSMKAVRKRQVSTKARKQDYDKRIKDFSDEVDAIGKKLEKSGEHWDNWFYKTFDGVGPLISSIFGLLILFLVSWVMSLVNLQANNVLLLSINEFLLENMGNFFMIFLFFSYASYFSRFTPRAYKPFSPIVSGFAFVVCMWIGISAINVVNLYLGSQTLFIISLVMDRFLPLIFWLVVFIGYLILILRMICCKKELVIMKKTKTKSGVRRLYRSGNDKILGGVCGGIGEYLGIDPVLIRLLWVIAVFGYGAGVLAYIVAWIIIPRNPKHKWK